MAAVFSAIGTAVATTATTVSQFFMGGGAAAGGTAAVGISRGLSIASALASIGQGAAASARLKDEAAFAGAQAEQELAAGAAQKRDLAREYAELTGEQQVIQLANGLDIGVGTPVSVKEATQRQAQRNLDVTRTNARNRSAMTRLRQRGLMSEARASIMAGFGSAAETGLNAYQLTG